MVLNIVIEKDEGGNASKAASTIDGKSFAAEIKQTCKSCKWNSALTDAWEENSKSSSNDEKRAKSHLTTTTRSC